MNAPPLLRLLPLLIPALFAAEVHATPISVAGVVVDDAGKRLSGVPVQLVGAIALTDDVTSDRGVFSLYTDDVDKSVDGLWIVCGGPTYFGDPVPIQVTHGATTVRRTKAPDVVCRTHKNTMLSSTEAKAFIRSIQETEALRLDAKLVTKDAAEQEALAASLLVLARLPQSEVTSTKLTAFYSTIETLPNGQKAVIPKDKFTNITQLADFKKAQRLVEPIILAPP